MQSRYVIAMALYKRTVCMCAVIKYFSLLDSAVKVVMCNFRNYIDLMHHFKVSSLSELVFKYKFRKIVVADHLYHNINSFIVLLSII